MLHKLLALVIVLSLSSCALEAEKSQPTTYHEQTQTQEAKPETVTKAEENKKANQRDLKEVSKKLHNLQNKLNEKE